MSGFEDERGNKMFRGPGPARFIRGGNFVTMRAWDTLVLSADRLHLN